MHVTLTSLHPPPDHIPTPRRIASAFNPPKPPKPPHPPPFATTLAPVNQLLDPRCLVPFEIEIYHGTRNKPRTPLRARSRPRRDLSANLSDVPIRKPYRVLLNHSFLPFPVLPRLPSIPDFAASEARLWSGSLRSRCPFHL